MLSSHPSIDSTTTHHDLCANAIDSGDHMRGGLRDCARNDSLPNQATATGIFPIRACHSFGPVMCAEVPPESTATVTGMSTTSNS